MHKKINLNNPSVKLHLQKNAYLLCYQYQQQQKKKLQTQLRPKNPFFLFPPRLAHKIDLSAIFKTLNSEIANFEKEHSSHKNGANFFHEIQYLQNLLKNKYGLSSRVVGSRCTRLQMPWSNVNLAVKLKPSKNPNAAVALFKSLEQKLRSDYKNNCQTKIYKKGGFASFILNLQTPRGKLKADLSCRYDD